MSLKSQIAKSLSGVSWSKEEAEKAFDTAGPFEIGWRGEVGTRGSIHHSTVFGSTEEEVSAKAADLADKKASAHPAAAPFGVDIYKETPGQFFNRVADAVGEELNS